MDLENSQKKDLESIRNLAMIFLEQIKAKAFELGYGELVVSFKVRNHEIKEAHVVKEQQKLRPF